MNSISRKQAKLFTLAAAIAFAGVIRAEDITIHLPASVSVSTKTVQYQCDAQGAKFGVPVGPFPVQYVNGGGNSLVVVPISGNPLIFSQLMSGSGVRYGALALIWWDAQGQVTLSFDSSDNTQSTCKVVNRK